MKLPGDRWFVSSVRGAPLKASGAPRVLEDAGMLCSFLSSCLAVSLSPLSLGSQEINLHSHGGSSA